MEADKYTLFKLNDNFNYRLVSTSDIFINRLLNKHRLLCELMTGVRLHFDKSSTTVYRKSVRRNDAAIKKYGWSHKKITTLNTQHLF
ncbi:MAG: hypothetical protein JWR61_4998 [Ferruginibacter sp.]|nr:hypothetical protein [Ferruginibacter sp.]